MDFIVANLNDLPSLIRNDRADSNHWIMFKLLGKKSNRDGIGARVTVVAGKQEQVWEIKRTVGLYSASDPRAHFGLGSYSKVDLVKVRWPSGKIQEFKSVPADFHYLVDEQEGIGREVIRR